MGVYKDIDSVPTKYRLQNHEPAYTGRDVWADYFEEKTAVFNAKSTRDRYEKAGRYLQNFMREAGRHHALAAPEHIERYLTGLRDGDIGRRNQSRKLQTVYFEYFQPLEGFYTWLQWHTEHPHVYHPVLMAVVEGGFTREVWDRKLEQNDKR
ncbi:hypothetical protein [Halorubrum sp. Atlit-26R]|uniref:hypothetical protein n=1 Tax=Halorubrum sp. Atlit-26R TaxID=2282128 RepID=UPI0011C419F2|nr:hypothetical protein [Halorubrum sp. Atlit-26R]